MAARARFSQKQIQGLNNSQLQDKLWKEKKINWNDYQTMHKRGACVVPGDSIQQEEYTRLWVVKEGKARGWKIDVAPPIFTKNRKYIESRFRWPSKE